MSKLQIARIIRDDECNPYCKWVHGGCIACCFCEGKSYQEMCGGCKKWYRNCKEAKQG